MKVNDELKNGFLIFIAIGSFFLIMELLGLGKLYYLRLINAFFVFYGVNRTIKMKIAQGELKFVPNAISGMITSLSGVFFSIIGLILYSYLRGGESYVSNLSKTFLFGGNPSINEYCISLLFEGIASSVLVTMFLMLYWNDKHIAD